MSAKSSKISHGAVIYARVSSKEQEKEGFSIPAQLKLLREYATRECLIVAKEFVDAETAKRSGRTGFNEMLMFLSRNPLVQHVLVEKTDRLYRNMRDWVTLDEYPNLVLHIVKEGGVLSADSRSHEKFIHGIKVLMAKNYVDNLSEETRKGMLEKASQGLWPSNAPFGYQNTQDAHGKRIIVPSEGAAPIVRQVFEWYLSGNYSVREVAKLLREAGYTVNAKAVKLSHGGVNNILRNPLYYGDFLWKKKLYRGSHEPLISREQWEDTQALLDTRLGDRRKTARHNFAFSGLIRCTICNRSLIGDIKKGQYIYYRCSGSTDRCRSISYTREEVFQTQFSEVLERLHFDNEVLEWVSAALKDNYKDHKQEHQEIISRLQREYQLLEGRIEEMYVDKLDGRIAQEFFDKKSAEWRNRQNAILETVHQHQNASQNYIEEGVKLLELAHNAHKLFAKQSATEKRRLLSLLLSNCFWDGKRLEIEFKQPFDLIAKSISEVEASEDLNGEETGDFEKWLPRLDSNQ